jgi:hypothetical protein
MAEPRPQRAVMTYDGQPNYAVSVMELEDGEVRRAHNGLSPLTKQTEAAR